MDYWNLLWFRRLYFNLISQFFVIYRSSFDDSSRKAKKTSRNANPIPPVFTRSTRSSTRLGINNAKPNYANENEDDDTDTESDD